MITARNYAAQAEHGLHMFCESNHENPSFSTDVAAAEAMSEMARVGVHFVLNDEGELLDDSLKGLKGKTINLPFSVITVEHYSPIKQEKILLLASDDDDAILIMACFNRPHTNTHLWYPEPYSIKLPKDINVTNERYTGTMNCRVTAKGMYEYNKQKGIPDDEFAQRIGTYERNIEEMIEVLSCRNVTTANHQDASPVNASRIKAGKLPLYETKMLVIDTKATGTSNGGSGGSHASPRQHLRRGHIRRHPTAGNLWINSCVVGDPSKGVINKSYAVK